MPHANTLARLMSGQVLVWGQVRQLRVGPSLWFLLQNTRVWRCDIRRSRCRSGQMSLLRHVLSVAGAGVAGGSVGVGWSGEGGEGASKEKGEGEERGVADDEGGGGGGGGGGRGWGGCGEWRGGGGGRSNSG